MLRKLVLFTLPFLCCINLHAIPSLIWTSTFNNTSDLDDAAFNVAVSSLNGNILVVGVTADSVTHENIFIAKYNKNGGLQWGIQQDFGGLLDVGYGVVADTNSNCYVTGTVTPYKGNSNILLEKFNSDGTTAWIKTIDYNDGNDEGRAITVDANTNIYITGIVSRPQSGQDIYVAKFDSTGTLIWSNVYTSSFNAPDAGFGVVVDTAGCVYVAGKKFNHTKTTFDIITLKYTSTGTLVWTSTYNTGQPNVNIGTDITIDANGNIKELGADWSNSNWDIILRTLNKSGTLVGTSRINGAAGGNDVAFRIIASTSGYLYTVGYEQLSTGNYAITARKLSTAGTLLSLIQYTTPGIKNISIGRGIAIDGNFVYIVGHENRSDIDQGYDIWIGKYNQ